MYSTPNSRYWWSSHLNGISGFWCFFVFLTQQSFQWHSIPAEAAALEWTGRVILCELPPVSSNKLKVIEKWKFENLESEVEIGEDRKFWHGKKKSEYKNQWKNIKGHPPTQKTKNKKLINVQ
jgi:hypothetical protein